ncbi:hypothetical protein BC826DRAFT_1014650 [Russula brevipes]|nr:hypothetical protein BC826DRAFT_1014650 [Russula brevipes]
MQPQVNRQDQLSYDPTILHGTAPATLPDSMPPGFASRTAPHYGAQTCTAYASDLTGSTPFRGFEQMQLGMNRGPTEQTLVGSGINYSTDVQGASSMGILGDGSNCTVTNSHGPVATSQPLCQDAYPTPNVQHGQFRQGPTNGVGYPFLADQLPANPMDLSPFAHGAHTAADSQETPPIWRLSDCRISYAEQSELHVTLVLRKMPPA